MRIYLAHPISGCSFDDVLEYYDDAVEVLADYGYEVMYPMVAKGYLRTEKKFRAHGYGQPLSQNHAIVERDRWMVKRANVFYANLLTATEVSIGCCMELAWAHDSRIHTIAAMQEDNMHQHAFVLECAHVILPTHVEVLAYLKKLIQGTL